MLLTHDCHLVLLFCWKGEVKHVTICKSFNYFVSFFGFQMELEDKCKCHWIFLICEAKHLKNHDIKFHSEFRLTRQQFLELSSAQLNIFCNIYNSARITCKLILIFYYTQILRPQNRVKHKQQRHCFCVCDERNGEN